MTEVRWDRVLEVIRLDESDWRAHNRAMLLLTPPEVAEKLGVPTSVTLGHSGYDTIWFYTHQDGVTCLMLYFKNHYVVRVEAECT